ncbi:phosphate ABC transporter permease PstA [Dehalobacter sp. DCM]|uniref:phosphate ABC transporter permease PstA n=1 Tax=Dehalobacter sp. DCM TaxID=2907827 RepID=UPI003081EEB9|nr:phosphate ABC transporter permease PstA [Dehalobacter sp. DCM]
MKGAARLEERIARIVLWLLAGCTLLVLLSIIAHILINGISGLSWDFISQNPRRMGKEGGILSVIIGTVYLTAAGVVLATPIGVGAAIFLTEYVKKGRLVQIIRFATESLAAVPSIIFGLFGFVLFVITLKMGWSILSGALTLAFMILPTIIRAAEEGIKTVPDSYREGSLALGATKWHTILKVVLPSALPGIATGVILGIGRAIGETAAVILTAGSSLGLPTSIFEPTRTLSVHLYILASEGISSQNAYASATVLIIVIVIINFLANRLMARLAGSKSISH